VVSFTPTLSLLLLGCLAPAPHQHRTRNPPLPRITRNRLVVLVWLCCSLLCVVWVSGLVFPYLVVIDRPAGTRTVPTVWCGLKR